MHCVSAAMKIEMYSFDLVIFSSIREGIIRKYLEFWGLPEVTSVRVSVKAQGIPQTPVTYWIHKRCKLKEKPEKLLIGS